MQKVTLLGLTLAFGLPLGACTVDTAGNTLAECQALTTTVPKRPAGWHGTVFTIVMENHSRGQIFGNADAPYINALAGGNAVAAGYHDPDIHPSNPNYIWMVAGQNFGLLNDDDPSASNHISAQGHLADQLELAGLSWKSYQESMGEPCGLQSHDTYAAKHDPFVYFDNINGWDGSVARGSQRCREHVVDYGELERDLASGAAPDYAFITPNLDDDMHDGSIAQGDAWLSRELPKILASDAYQKGGVIFLLWDEGGGTPAQDDPPFMAISPYAKPGYQTQTSYDTSSYLMTVQSLLGLDMLPCGASHVTPIATMDELFTQPIHPATP